nr:hypothetical protein [Tanacetum cinerariifolium]
MLKATHKVLAAARKVLAAARKVLAAAREVVTAVREGVTSPFLLMKVHGLLGVVCYDREAASSEMQIWKNVPVPMYDMESRSVELVEYALRDLFLHSDNRFDHVSIFPIRRNGSRTLQAG